MPVLTTLESTILDEIPGWVLLLGATVVFYAIWTLSVAFKPSLRKVPGPWAASLSRIYLAFHGTQGDAHNLYQDLHRKYGEVVRIGPNKISVADPAMIPTIFGIGSQYQKTELYSAFTAVRAGRIFDNLFSQRDREVHKREKSIVAQAYSLSSLRKLEPLVDKCTNVFMESMKLMAGQPVDLGEWVQWYAFDVIGNITFLQMFGFMENREDRLGLIDAIEAGIQYSTIVGQFPELHPWLVGNQRLTEFLRKWPATAKFDPTIQIDKLIEKTISTYNTSMKSQRGDFFEFLRSIQDKSPERIPHDSLINHLSTNIFTGSDTTAMALRAIFYFLVKTPSVYKKLQEEIDEADREGKFSEVIEFSQGQQLLYLQAVMKEALRLHPGVALPLERYVPEGGVMISGKFIPEGTIVGINAWVVHHDKRVYGEDADDFRPERWLEAEPAQLKLMDQAFLSFGHGSRTCIGKNISILEITKFVPQLLRHFTLEWASPKDEWEISGFFFAKQTGVIMHVLPRKE